MKSSRTSLATARARRARARSSIASARSISISGEAVGDISFLCAYERRLSCFSNWPIEVKRFKRSTGSILTSRAGSALLSGIGTIGPPMMGSGG